MESATFVHKSENRVNLGAPVRMVMLKDKHIVEAGLSTRLVSARRVLFYNRRVNIVTALTRRGQKDETELPFDVVDLFATADQDAAIAVGKKGEIATIEFKLSTEGQVILTVVTGSVAAEVVAATFAGSVLEPVALLANGAVVKLSADLKTVTELRGETPFKGKFITAFEDYVLVPSKDAVDVISFSTKKSALSSPWVPHSQGEPIIFAYIFRKWKPTGGSNLVLTVGANGREVRLWTGLGNNSLTLAAHLSLDIPKDVEKRVTVADQEENVLVAFDTTVIVLSTDESKIRFARATEWENESAGPIAAFNEVTKAGSYSLSLVTRSSDGISSVKLPPSIFGTPNLTADGATAPKTATHEANYFAAAATKDVNPAVQVSSSLTPSNTQEGSVLEKHAAQSIANVSNSVAQKLASLNNTAATTHKGVSTFISTLQLQTTQAAAAKQGKEHASRNASRFTNQQSASPSATAATPSANSEAANQLTLIGEGFGSVVEQTILNRTNALIVPKIKGAVDIVSGGDDGSDLPLPKLSALPQMQSFNANIDKALKTQNDYLKSEADARASAYNAQVVRASTSSRQAIAESKKFLNDLKSELAGLTNDIEAVKKELAATSDRSAIGAVSSANVVETAVALVEKKDVEKAVQQVTQAKNIQLLLEFLTHPTVKVAVEDGALGPTSISVPSFGMLVQQLSADLDASKGHIAPRVSLLFTIAMDWDDFIDATNEGNDAKAKGLLSTLAPSIAVARRNIDGLVAIKNDVSIESRRQARTVGRILEKIQ